MYFVLDEKGNKIEGYDKQGFLAVLQQAIADGDLEGIDADSAFVSKLKCCVGGGTFKVAFVTQAVYNELREAGQLVTNALYFITDDETEVNLESLVAQLRTDLDSLSETVDDILDGTTAVNNSTHVNGLEIKETSGILKIGNKIIPQREVIYNTPIDITSSGVELSDLGLVAGDVIEVEIAPRGIDGFLDIISIVKVKIANNGNSSYSPVVYYFQQQTAYSFTNNSTTNKLHISTAQQIVNVSSLNTNTPVSSSSTMTGSYGKLLKITKIIE